jgi:hypothetical protein
VIPELSGLIREYETSLPVATDPDEKWRLRRMFEVVHASRRDSNSALFLRLRFLLRLRFQRDFYRILELEGTVMARASSFPLGQPGLPALRVPTAESFFVVWISPNALL